MDFKNLIQQTKLLADQVLNSETSEFNLEDSIKQYSFKLDQLLEVLNTNSDESKALNKENYEMEIKELADMHSKILSIISCLTKDAAHDLQLFKSKAKALYAYHKPLAPLQDPINTRKKG